MSITFKEKYGRIIRLTDERIGHIGYHMHIGNKLYLIEETLKNPDIISENNERKNVFYYQKYLKTEAVYFIVVIRIGNNEGFIVTIFKSRKQKQ